MANTQRGTSLSPVNRGSRDIGYYDNDQETDFWGPGSFFNASPWQVMRRMQEDMDRAFGTMFVPGRSGLGGSTGQGMQTWTPTVDISQTDNEYCVEVDLPGVNKDSINVDVQDHELRIRAEMRQDNQQPVYAQQTGYGQQQ